MKTVARALLLAEPMFLVVAVAIFWTSAPNRGWALLLFAPGIAARLIAYRAPWLHTRLNIVLFAFLGLAVLNTWIAQSSPGHPPYSWGWYMLERPFFGVLFALGLASSIRDRGSIEGAVFSTVLVAVLVGVLGLGSAQYSDTKLEPLMPLIEHIPQLRGFPGAESGFNVNEVGGAMAFFLPFVFGIAGAFAWRTRIVALAALVLLALAMFFGQSRFALGGTVLACAALTFLVIPAGRWRYAALAGLIALAAVEFGLVMNLITFAPATTSSGDELALSARDVDSLDTRVTIWNAGLSIVRDYPLTGVGLNMFRSSTVRASYPVPNFAMNVVPHTHNELLQVGTDLGIPGAFLYLAWHIVLAWMLFRAWRRGTRLEKAAAASVAAGLGAHAIFGLADAITLFDRFIWAYWLLVGLGIGVYGLVCQRERGVLETLASETPALDPPAPGVSVCVRINLRKGCFVGAHGGAPSRL